MKRFEITLTGLTPLIMHADNVGWADRMERWKNDPANKKVSKAGDDRSPAWRWVGCLYHDGGKVVIPADNLQKVMSEGGALVPVPGSKHGKTFKAQTQSGVLVDGAAWVLLTGGQSVSMTDVEAMLAVDSFDDHVTLSAAIGVELFVKRAKVMMAKHIRVRPRFNNWSCAGTVTVVDEQITPEVLADIWTYAGRYKGLGDWRPGSPKAPGPWGRFTAAVMELPA